MPHVSLSAPFAVALKAAIADRGLALNRIQARLAERGFHVGVATLSTWQSGHRRPSPESRAIVGALEEVLSLPEGWLVVRMAEGQESGRRSKHFTSLVDYGASLTKLLEEVRREAHGRTQSVSVTEELTLGANREIVKKRVIHALTAVQETDRQIVTHRGEDGCDAELLALRAVSGCRTGRVARDKESGAMMGELLLDRTLRVGETAVLRYEVEDRNNLESEFYYRFGEREGAHYVLEVQFHRDAMPVRVSEFRRRRSDDPDDVRRELMMSPDGRVHVVVPSVEHPVIGIAWEWS